ncbi:hypothetical protein GYH30_025183 [Glycine max]|nr:hypothetical protein GYH30_025183 [Glycine max]
MLCRSNLGLTEKKQPDKITPGEDLTFNMSLKVGNMSLVVALEQYISFFQR